MRELEKELKIFREEENKEEIKEKATIIGFEKFDCSNKFTGEKVEGKEILERAAEILPAGLYWENIRRIEYRNEVKPTKDKYGLKGVSAEIYNEIEKSIIFYEVPKWSKLYYLLAFRHLLAHGFGHSIDSDLVEQKDLSEGDRYEMLIEWRKVRREEPPFSSYVKEIKNKNKRVEESLKRDEDLAESIEFVLTNPLYVSTEAPRRHDFCIKWLKKRFPEFDPEKISEKKEKYLSFLADLKLE